MMMPAAGLFGLICGRFRKRLWGRPCPAGRGGMLFRPSPAAHPVDLPRPEISESKAQACRTTGMRLLNYTQLFSPPILQVLCTCNPWAFRGASRRHAASGMFPPRENGHYLPEMQVFRPAYCPFSRGAELFYFIMRSLHSN